MSGGEQFAGLKRWWHSEKGAIVLCLDCREKFGSAKDARMHQKRKHPERVPKAGDEWRRRNRSW